MSVIIDRNKIWTCRDCGESIDAKTIERLCDQLRAQPEALAPDVDDAHYAALNVTMPGACAVCGGGRVVCRLGELRLA